MQYSTGRCFFVSVGLSAVRLEVSAMKPFTTVAIAIFTIVAVVHLFRILLGWEVIIHGIVIPMWASYLGLVIAGGLAFLLWRESR